MKCTSVQKHTDCRPHEFVIEGTSTDEKVHGIFVLVNRVRAHFTLSAVIVGASANRCCISTWLFEIKVPRPGLWCADCPKMPQKLCRGGADHLSPTEASSTEES